MTDSATVWLAIAVAGVGTFLIRFSFLFLFEYLSEVPDGAQRALRFVPAAVLAALVLPALVIVEGSPSVSLGNERLLAGLVAAVVAWRTESIFATIVVGMVVLVGLQMVP
ncbi:AzlD domain-containing protein [Natronomonas gomsonensis]|uniref:AzlD domain-containing protein n=1 Tax=Natronomonas gomsonensis TaxID=1046043 RepID=UPI0015B856F3|nr:AzlD domain-containing protein [Natronomonas gomsonensis]